MVLANNSFRRLALKLNFNVFEKKNFENRSTRTDFGAIFFSSSCRVKLRARNSGKECEKLQTALKSVLVDPFSKLFFSNTLKFNFKASLQKNFLLKITSS